MPKRPTSPPVGSPLALSARRVECIRDSLLSWYSRMGRVFPWRDTADLYRLWVAEVMLQQTQASRVIGYYDRFIERFPSVEELAKARWASVLSQWRGLGYYRRARNLHVAAKRIVANGGNLPDSLEAFLALPGIGRNSAHSILSAGFQWPYAVLDTNVRRVIVRLFKHRLTSSAQNDPTSHKSNLHLWAIADRLISPLHPFEFNQAMMDLGATVCVVKLPKCDECPLSKHCDSAFLAEATASPSRKGAARKMPIRKILLRITSPSGVLFLRNGGPRLQLPRVAPKRGDEIRAVIKRWVKENLGVEVSVRPPTPNPELKSGIATCRCQVLRKCGPAKLDCVWRELP